MRSDKGWPPDETPVAVKAEVMGTLRDDEPLAVLVLKDMLGCERHVQPPTTVELDVLEGLAKYEVASV